ncbi:MAG: hypothetical protein Ct9H300mP31_09570 [Acidimicrobiaceae bacterium]|nr:MAG: hypothetical protein Ct9H300mP31_09570 [Acidimicrobiaceae bacterium]
MDLKVIQMLEVVAAVDCGTNSTRLLIGDGEQTLDRRMRITRMGEGVDSTGRLDPGAVERVLVVLREYREVLDHHGVTRCRVIATSAARDATNREEFFDAAEETLGHRPELLSGPEEGRLSFAGATAELDPADGPFLVVDIGGGSTEFVVGTIEAEAARSCDIGCVRLSEQWIHHDPPLPEELVACLSITESHLDDVVREVSGVSEARTLVGLAGTVSCAAAVELGLATYDRDRIHHFRLSKEATEDVFRTLATENRAERLANPGMEEERADVIVGGMAILVKVMPQSWASTSVSSRSPTSWTVWWPHSSPERQRGKEVSPQGRTFPRVVVFAVGWPACRTQTASSWVPVLVTPTQRSLRPLDVRSSATSTPTSSPFWMRPTTGSVRSSGRITR